MAFIPPKAQWYLADLILEHTIEGDPRNIIHVNICLVQAASPEEAYAKGVNLGKAEERKYENPEGKMVRVRFRGFRELNVIHDDLGDGAELSYEESVGVPEEQLQQWITAKERLAVFRPRCMEKDLPNYMPRWVQETLEDMGFSKEDLQGEQEQ